MTNERGAMPATSTTLYFGPWYRRSPYFESTRKAGCSAYDIYNHMLLPAYYDDPETEYWALANDVTLWDVGVERKIVGLEVDGEPFEALNNTKWPVTADGARIGKVTSAIYSPRLGKNIGFAWVPVGSAAVGTSLGVESEWGTRGAVVVDMPFVDPNKQIPVS